ncbi:M10 family metallopeptidase C-terminal domain-containing protein [Roseomonas sp. CCTCC AB2023176]|uniref:M10 family metallopeptidase C-terminal domain-containing protein n=1 Tax=Roseomonas sp. CCTCC AB2023176 TaxID=3342640 RepID=UPI0035D54942
MAGARTVAPTGDALIDPLLKGVAWDNQTITYSIPTTGAGWGDGYPRTVSFDPDGPFNPATGAGSADPYNITVDETTGFVALNAYQSAAVNVALAEVESFTNLTINRNWATPLTADLRFAMTTTPGPSGTIQNPTPAQWTAYGQYPATGRGGDAWFNTVDYNNADLGTFDYQTFYHEIGHTLGLKHTHAETVGGVANSPILPTEWDSLEFTTMTYLESVGAPDNGYQTPAGSLPQSYMMLDIQALQTLYGADYSTNAGNTVWRFDYGTGRTSRDGTSLGTPDDGVVGNAPTNILFRTIWDGGGVDTYDFSSYQTRLRVDLAPGGFTDVDADGTYQAALLDPRGADPDIYARGQVFNALLFRGNTASLIENAIGGTNDDTMFGNQGDNRLEGRDGRDYLVGLLGNDLLIGGNGNDRLNGDDGADTLVGGVGADNLNGGAGTDLADYTNAGAAIGLDLIGFFPNAGDAVGDRFTSVEAYRGSNFNDTMSGSGNVEDLSGGFGTDVLNGRGGNDALRGDVGDDTLVGGAGADIINGGEGYDTAVFNEAAVLLNLTTGLHGGEAAGDTYASVERFVGGTGNDTMTGDAFANDLVGSEGNDLLEGAGGADRLYGNLGNDTLRGGEGDDTLYGGLGADVYEGGNGFDRVSFADQTAGVAVDISPGPIGQVVNPIQVFSIEDFEGSAYGDAFYGRANEANYFYGGGGNDTLAGRGGGDVLRGEAGDDTIIVVGTELSVDGGFSGFDTLAVGGTAGVFNWSTNSFSVDGQGIFQVLNMEIARGGVGGDQFIANNDDLSFYGGDGNDTLSGGGGDNVLEGGAGADRLFFGGGYDYADYRTDTVGVLVDIRASVVTGGHATADTWLDRPEGLLAGAGNDSLGGSEGDNRILGRGGADYISAYGGADTLDGGEGNDSLEGGSGADQAFGGDGADAIVDTQGLLLPQGVEDNADDTLAGGAGNDTLIAGGGADVLDGGDDDDRLTGGAGADFLSGGVGNDILSDHTQQPAFAGASPAAGSFAASDADTLNGGLGDDWIYASGGGDLIDGGTGTDSLVLSFADALEVVSFAFKAVGPWSVALGATVAATVQGVEGLSVTGGVKNDVMTGTGMTFAAVFDGGAGNDLLRGGKGGDVLIGSGGNDRLYGNDGDDLLVGGVGRDIMAGGAGADLFRWDLAAEGKDIIQGFVSGEDKLWIDASGFRGGLTEGMDLAATNRFVPGTAATGIQGQFLYDQGTGALLWDVDGNRDKAAFLICNLDPGTALAASDFLLVA